MSGDFLGRQFQLGAETPAIWGLSARRLKRAGDLLFDLYVADLEAMAREVSPLDLENLEVVGPATLLLGLATENILKAIAIEKNPQSMKDGKLRDWPPGHDLVRLAELAGIELNEKQRDLLQRIGAFVEWAGRYPIPKKATKLAIRQLNINRPFLPLPLQPYERQDFEALFGNLYSMVIIEERAVDSSEEAG